jgi:signal transduction histidine kinase
MTSQISILYIEDDKVDQQAFIRAVRKANLPYNYLVVSTLQNACQILKDKAFDLILCDFLLSDGTALDFIQKHPDYPIIVITGGGDEATAVNVMKAGARDYLTKSSNGDYLRQLPKSISRLMHVLELEAIGAEQRTFIRLVHDTVRILNSTLDLDEVIRLILKNVSDIIPNDGANVMLIAEDVAHIVKCQGDFSKNEDTPIDNGFLVGEVDFLQEMRETRHAYRINDVAAYGEWRGIAPGHEPRSYLAAPITIADEVIGFLNLYSLSRGYFTELHQQRLQTFVDHVAVAIKNARLYQQARNFAILEERQRLARDLHDSVTQTLFAASVVTKSMIRDWKQNPHAIEEDLFELGNLTSGALAEMRTLLFELYPRAMYETDLRTLLWQLSESAKGRAHVNVIFESEGNCHLPSIVHGAFFRIAQEALNNVVKHAQARHLHFQLKCEDVGAELRICDDGNGFDISAVTSEHLGIKIMQERATGARILLTIESNLTEGTRVRLVWRRREEDE